jgi:hypothetical protein
MSTNSENIEMPRRYVELDFVSLPIVSEGWITLFENFCVVLMTVLLVVI